MIDSLTSEETLTDPESDVLPPGDILRQRRQELGASLAEMESSLHIPQAKIEALENNDFEDFDAPVYVCGYLRSCARYLDLDAELLVQSYKCLLSEPGGDGEGDGDAARMSSSSSSATLMSRLPGGGGNKKWFVWGSTAVAALMFSVMLLTTGEHREAPLPEPLASATFDDDVELNKPAEFTVAATQIPDAADQSQDLAAEAGDAGNAAETDQSKLDFSFSDDCWVEVKDKNSQLVFADLKHNGDNLRLFGEAPFKVMLGNARAASLSIDGKAVALSVGPNRNTLRLTVAAP